MKKEISRAMWKPGTKAPSAPDTSPKAAQTSIKSVSAQTKALKFMRKGAREAIEMPAEPMPHVADILSPTESKSTTSAQQSSAHQWRLTVVVPKPVQKTSAAVLANLQAHVLARRSFQGFNLPIERNYEEVRNPEAAKKRRQDEAAISDMEMANFYRDRVGAHLPGEKKANRDPNAAKRKKR